MNRSERLTNVDYGDGQTQSYTFDAMGNRLQRQDSASGATNYSYNAANMLLSTGGYGASGFNNDADGNTLVGNGRTNAWDSQNRLVSCIIGGNTTAYKYGADGLRRQSTKNGASTDYAYDGTMLVREGHASGGSLTPSSVTATYLIGARGPEYRRDDTQAEVDSQGRTVTKARWYVFDGLGSVVGEVDPLGNLTSSPKYDVYGVVRANGGTATSKQGFVGALGHVSDDTGLVYMRARYYDPAVGRFNSEDPSKNGINWFAYCGNSPTNFVDESGRKFSMIGPALLLFEILDESGVFKNVEGFASVLKLVLSTKAAAELFLNLQETYDSAKKLYAGIEAGEDVDVRQRLTACGQFMAVAGAYGIACICIAEQIIMLGLMGCDDGLGEAGASSSSSHESKE